jgi:hypothetical protein
MSWLFSQALVEAFSGASSLGGEPCVPLSVMPTPHKFLHNDKTIYCSNLFRFGLMCAVLTEDRGAELLTSFLEDSRARTSAWRERAPESPEPGPGFGASLPGSLARFDPVSSSWKTPQCSLLEGLDEFSETWPRWGTMRNGVCWVRTTLELPTSENESGFWPTPQAHDCHPGNPARVGRFGTKHGGRNLNDEVAMWPTPTKRDWKSGTGDQGRPGHALPLSSAIGGQLNPPWVEWLMGWPIGWTDLKPLETDRFHKWPNSHSEPSTAD